MELSQNCIVSKAAYGRLRGGAIRLYRPWGVRYSRLLYEKGEEPQAHSMRDETCLRDHESHERGSSSSVRLSSIPDSLLAC